jgi:hypothetical protein
MLMQKSMMKLLASSGASQMRFWGKIKGTEFDYFIVEGKLEGGGDEGGDVLELMSMCIGYAIVSLNTGSSYQMLNHRKSKKLDASNLISLVMSKEEFSQTHFTLIKKPYI